MRTLFPFIVCVLLASVTCGQGTFNVLSCKYLDVNAAINNTVPATPGSPQHLAVTGDTIVLPLCTNTTPQSLNAGNTWGDNTTANVQQLKINACITLKGQDSPGGNAGGTNQTIILQNNYGQGNNGGPFSVILVQPSSCGDKLARVTGITFRAVNSDQALASAFIKVFPFGPMHALRVDHDEFDSDQFAGASNANCDVTQRWEGIVGDGDVWAVIDHNLYQACRRRFVFITGAYFGDPNQTAGHANFSWSTADSMGMPGFPANQYNATTGTCNGVGTVPCQAGWVFENNTINQLVSNTGSNSIACEQGARCVTRFNNVIQSVGQHGLEQSNTQGLRHHEVYGNPFTLPTFAPANGCNPACQSCAPGTVQITCNGAKAIANRGGIAMYFENTATSNVYTYNGMVTVDDLRCNTAACNANSGGGFSPWFMCIGTIAWDYIVGFPSTNPGPTPCMNQIGRGKGDFINLASAAWPHETLDGSYYYANKMDGVTDPASLAGTVGSPAQYFINLDYYDGTTSFTGVTGVGHGLLTSIPSSCTVYTAQDGQTSSVAYWATDQGNWNQSSATFWDGTSQGILYKCSPTNNGHNCVPASVTSNFWCQWYEPFTYPHPLTTGTLQATSPVCSPTAGGYTVISLSVSCTNPSSTPVECYTLDGTLPVTNGGSGCTNGSVLSGSVVVTLTIPGVTLKVVAGGTGFGDSAPAVNTYTFLPIITTPQSFT